MVQDTSEVIEEAEQITHSRPTLLESLGTFLQILISTPTVGPDVVGPDLGKMTVEQFLNHARSGLNYYAEIITGNEGIVRAFAFHKLLLACNSSLTLGNVEKLLSGDPVLDKKNLSKYTAPYMPAGNVYQPTWLAHALNQQAALDTALDLIHRDVLNEHEKEKIRQTATSISPNGTEYSITMRNPQPFAVSKPGFTPHVNLCELHSEFKGLAARAQDIREAISPTQKV